MARFPKLTLCLLLCVAWAGVPAGAQKQPAPAAPATPYSNVRRDSLLNGLQVVTLDRAGEPLLRCDLVIRHGAMFDLADKVGLASLTQEALLAVNPRLKEEFESLRATIDWGADWDTTWFRFEVPPANFETAMEILGRLLVAENVRQEAFAGAHRSRLEAVRARAGQALPAERADAAFLAALYGNHPYGHGVEGDERSVASIVRGDAYDYLKRFYIANNTFAVVVGEITHERVMRAFKAYYGGWVKGQLVPATFRQPPRATAVRLVKVEAPEAPEVELRGGLVGLKATDADFAAGALLARVLEARLKKELSAAGAIRVGVSAAPRLLAGPFYFAAAAPADRAAEVSRRATDGFAGLATAVPTVEELAAAKAHLTGDFAARPIADHLRMIEAYGLPRNYPLTFAERVNALTGADLQRVAKRLLEANALTVVVLGRLSENFKSEI